jgi:hypothetical protein
MNEERIIERLDAMVAADRITEDEATRLRASVGTADFDDVLAGIRARHAQVHTDDAVAVGRMSSDEADGLVERVRAGEHSSELRRHIKDAR